MKPTPQSALHRVCALGKWRHGEVLELAPELTRQHLQAQTINIKPLPKRFVIDGSALVKLDSAGLAALCLLLEAAHQQHADEASVVYSWHNMPPIFQQLSELYHLPFNPTTTA